VRRDAVDSGTNFTIFLIKPDAFTLMLKREVTSSKISTALRGVTTQKNLHYRRKKHKSHIIIYFSIAYAHECSFYIMYCHSKKYLIDCQNLRCELEELVTKNKKTLKFKEGILRKCIL